MISLDLSELEMSKRAGHYERIHDFDLHLDVKKPRFISMRSRSYDNLLSRNELDSYNTPSSRGVASPLSDIFPLTGDSYPPSHLRPVLCENCGKLLRSGNSSRRRSSVELMLSPDTPSSPRFVTVAYSPELQVSENYFDLWSAEDQERIECLIEGKSTEKTSLAREELESGQKYPATTGSIALPNRSLDNYQKPVSKKIDVDDNGDQEIREPVFVKKSKDSDSENQNPVLDSNSCEVPETAYESDISSISSSDDTDIYGFIEDGHQSVMYKERVTVNVIVDVLNSVGDSDSDGGDVRVPKQNYKERVQVNLMLDLKESRDLFDSDGEPSDEDAEKNLFIENDLSRVVSSESDRNTEEHMLHVISTEDGKFVDDDMTSTGDIKALKRLESVPLFYQAESKLEPECVEPHVSSQNTAVVDKAVLSCQELSIDGRQQVTVHQGKKERSQQPQLQVEEDIIQMFAEAVQHLPSTDFFEFSEEEKLTDNTTDASATKTEIEEEFVDVTTTNLLSHVDINEESLSIPHEKQTEETTIKLKKPTIGTIVYTETFEDDSDKCDLIPVDVLLAGEKQANATTEIFKHFGGASSLVENPVKESKIPLDPGTALIEFTPNRKKIIIEDDILEMKKQPEFEETPDSLDGEPGPTQFCIIKEDVLELRLTENPGNLENRVPSQSPVKSEIAFDLQKRLIVQIKAHYPNLGPMVSSVSTRF